jgi:hypothetical protein
MKQPPNSRPHADARERIAFATAFRRAPVRRLPDPVRGVRAGRESSTVGAAMPTSKVHPHSVGARREGVQVQTIGNNDRKFLRVRAAKSEWLRHISVR